MIGLGCSRRGLPSLRGLPRPRLAPHHITFASHRIASRRIASHRREGREKARAASHRIASHRREGRKKVWAASRRLAAAQPLLASRRITRASHRVAPRRRRRGEGVGASPRRPASGVQGEQGFANERGKGGEEPHQSVMIEARAAAGPRRMGDRALAPRSRRTLRPGGVHEPGHCSATEQGWMAASTEGNRQWEMAA
eukprot:scaffold13_cov377-Prasinococcus_capsulatus_cf.AAC.6